MEFNKIISDMAKLESKDLTNLMILSKRVGEIRKDELLRMPLHINVISISSQGKLRETAHSSILQHFLKNQFILDSFTQEILELNEGKRLRASKVRPAEKDRMDISIYEKDICIIIENKVNDACEQNGQIFRYVQSALGEGYNEKDIKVLYLNSSHHDKPTYKSLTENGEGKNRIAKVVENSIIVKDYAHDIYEWVKNLPALLNDEEKYLHSALCQYQDYLEERFCLTDKFNNMKERIRRTIKESILKELSSCEVTDYAECITRLNDAQEELNELLNGVNELIDELSIKQEAVKIQKELDCDRLKLIDLSDYGYDEHNYGVEISLNGKIGYIAYGYGNKEYIGFAFNTFSLSRTEMSFLNRLFCRFGKERREEDYWPCWDYIGELSLLKEYTEFVQFVEKTAMNEDKCNIEFK